MENQAVTVEQLDSWVKDYKDQRQKCEEMGAALAVENNKKAQIEGQIAQALKDLGRDKYQTPEGTLFFTRKWRFNLPAEGEDHTKFIEWLREQKIDGKYLTVNSTSYNSLMNQEREAAMREGRLNLDIPGVPEPKMFETIGFRKGKS